MPFVTGRRKGGSWEIYPPMQDAADLQIEHYQQESALKFAEKLTAYPMLAGNGVEPERDSNGEIRPVTVGPGLCLYAPPAGQGSGGSWQFIEPSASSLKHLSDEVDKTEKKMRELGRQPLTAQSGNLTRITTAYAAQKGNAAIQAWALNLQDALMRLLNYTAMWLREPGGARPIINTEFDLSLREDDGFKHVSEMRRNGDISRAALIHEAKRRSLLDPDYDPDDDLDRILADFESDFEPVRDEAQPPEGEGATELESSQSQEGEENEAENA